MTRPGTMVLVAVAAIGVGCTTSSRSANPAPVATAPPAPADTAKTSGSQATTLCPMDVPGAHVAAADTADGEALTFTTGTSQPEARDQLRRSVRAMADAINGGQATGATASGGAGGASTGSTGSADASSEPMPAQTLPASHASVDDTGEGIRLTVTPNDPADLARLQGVMRTRVDQMLKSGTCASP